MLGPYSGSLAAALAVLAFVAHRAQDGRHFVVAAILLGNWLVNTGFAALLGQDYWAGLAAVDWITAVVVLASAYGRLALVIAITYAIQLVAHCGYGMSDHGPWTRYYYWWGLYAVAWGQALTVLAWIIHDGLKVGRDSRDPQGHALDHREGAGTLASRRRDR